MKRKIASMLALVMVLCMALPQAALAATTYYIDVSISGPGTDGENTQVSASSSHYGTLTTGLTSTIVELINSKTSDFAEKYAGKGLRETFENGLKAYKEDDSAWSSYVEQNLGAVSGSESFVNALKDRSSTYSALTLNQENRVSYAAGSNTYVVTVTLRSYTTGSSGGTSSGTTTETTQNSDGSVTTVTTNSATGTVTETTRDPNGVTGTTVTDGEGTITDVSAVIPASAAAEAAETGTAISLPVEVPNVTSSESAPVVSVTISGSGESIKVEIPVQTVSPGLVAVIVDSNGEETIVPKSVVTEDGVMLELDGSADVKIIDYSKEFDDVSDTNWASDAVAFVSARGLFQGVSETTFAPNSPMTRGMLATVLYRLESEPDATIQDAFGDVANDAYYADGVYWASEAGVVTGYDNGTYQPDKNISRQELVTMLYRYAGAPAVEDNTLDYSDAQAVQDYAADAMRWAVDNGIIQGMPDGTLNPQGMATRAQVALILERFCSYVMNG